MSKLDQLLAMEVTRRQFLVTLGMGIAGLFGLSSLMGILSHNETKSNDIVGYGMRDYGP
jgi:hypothetical protein